MVIKKRELVFALSVLALCTTFSINLQAKEKTNDVKKEIKKATEKLLAKEKVNKHKIPDFLKPEYDAAIETATTAISDFIEKIGSIVLKSNLNHSVKNGIDQRLQEYDLTRANIPFGLIREFNSRKKAIKKEVKKLIKKKDDYISKTDLVSIIEKYLDEDFMKILEENAVPAWHLPNMIGNAWQNFVGAGDDDYEKEEEEEEEENEEIEAEEEIEEIEEIDGIEEEAEKEKEKRSYEYDDPGKWEVSRRMPPRYDF